MGPPPSMSSYHLVSVITFFCLCVLSVLFLSRKSASNVSSMLDMFEDLAMDRLTQDPQFYCTWCLFMKWFPSATTYSRMNKTCLSCPLPEKHLRPALSCMCFFVTSCYLIVRCETIQDRLGYLNVLIVKDKLPERNIARARLHYPILKLDHFLPHNLQMYNKLLVSGRAN